MATLKISDLSVGDWVRCGRWNGRIQRIAMHDGKTVEVIIKGDCGLLYMYKRIYEINPIPITAEILEKNGWRVIEKDLFGDEYEYDGEERVWDDENCTIEICEARQGVFWYSWRSEYYMWRLEYVHQLQHLVRLAGVDKEINL